jgi:hypothetical protein
VVGADVGILAVLNQQDRTGTEGYARYREAEP